MATIRQSIDINVPVHLVYQRLTQFEDYPQFMDDIETVQQLDDTHLHWTTTMSNRAMEWDAEITEQEADRCIAWHNTGGPIDTGRVEVQSAGPDISRVTFTLQAPAQMPGSPAGNGEEEMAQRLKQDLARLKDFIEAAGQPQDSLPADESMQSDYSLSKSASDDSADDGRFSIAAEVNLDQQSDQARRVGQMPKDSGTPSAADAMAKALQPEQRDSQEADALKPSISRAVPPSV